MNLIEAFIPNFRLKYV